MQSKIAIQLYVPNFDITKGEVPVTIIIIIFFFNEIFLSQMYQILKIYWNLKSPHFKFKVGITKIEVPVTFEMFY